MMRVSPVSCAMAILLISACANEPEQPEQVNQTELAQPTKVPLQSRHRAEQKMAVAGAMMHDMALSQHLYLPPNNVITEKYLETPENGLFVTNEQPVSTFSIDVDTGSYTNIRRMLNHGLLPPADAVRVEDFINYFDYHYAPAASGQTFNLDTQLALSPWNNGRHLLKISLMGSQPEAQWQKPANLVFLVDVSGSMKAPDKLPLLIQSLRLLTSQLDKQDKVSIVTYAGQSNTLLASASGDQQLQIMQALDSLSAGGSTNGEGGIRQAYHLARANFIQEGVNRVILATDGDFNVGISDLEQLKDLIRQQRQSGVALTTLGFGSGNYNDALMESLSNLGNGQHAYIDNINEARKVLIDELSASMEIIASDVKIQVEFNPAVVAEYRLVGYQNRMLAREDFNNDHVDAGEVGAGHRVTALYELALTTSDIRQVDPLRYAENNQATSFSNELAQIKLRYKQPGNNASQLQSTIVSLQDHSREVDGDFAFAAAAAGFAQLLKGGKYMQHTGFADILQLAERGKGQDSHGYRSEFIRLVRSADALTTSQAGTL